ncbi:MAG TPA: hypothetical protein VK856_00255 [Anaerolineaceae bacterium]|nr:hypothetical protein [Anaerolineaceae bacterium]
MPPEEEALRTHLNEIDPTLQQSSRIDVDELAKEVMKLIKKNLREENERSPR